MLKAREAEDDWAKHTAIRMCKRTSHMPKKNLNENH